ncbi:iron chaperone [Salinicoccus hispanicus]|uniref:Iron chaperone n=1 Tax=Salinicoccus hispanicus TaxID=157225 RepID=A0A6N8U4U3_9STAP|nr:iron chaperone [Salinicoccus hispanicus]MXQ50619.1 iron chaperone [Salinicoccus hispanicus]
MVLFQEFLDKMDDMEHREKLEEVLMWIQQSYPGLGTVIKWNQPMFTEHGTFIIAFSVSKKHFTIAPETAGINHHKGDIEAAGYDYTENIIRVPWDKPVDYGLLEKLIGFNIEDKADCTTFWRK